MVIGIARLKAPDQEILNKSLSSNGKAQRNMKVNVTRKEREQLADERISAITLVCIPQNKINERETLSVE